MNRKGNKALNMLERNKEEFVWIARNNADDYPKSLWTMSEGSYRRTLWRGPKTNLSVSSDVFGRGD